MKVFLGGTIKSNWRSLVIPKLKIDYFNPVKEEWNEEIKALVDIERKESDYCLYVITPKMQEGRALDEIREEAIARPDRIIFTYLLDDEGIQYNEDTLEKLSHLKSEVIANGAIYCESIDETVHYLNSITDSNRKLLLNEGYTDCFISYGRRHSSFFARQLYNNLKNAGCSSWFDMNDIPLAVDFQEQIDEGIKNADNFIFIISPHSVKSEYCLKEIILAIKYGKRIIPILHVEPSDCWEKMHSEIGKRNWIYIRQFPDETKPLNEWTFIDSFDSGFKRLLSVIETQKEYVRMHTGILHYAIEWNNNQKKTEYLLVGTDREEAEKWLMTKEFANNQGKQIQAPCECTDIQAEYICESKKNGENLLTDVFIGYSTENLAEQQKIIKALNRFGITCWLHSADIKKGDNFSKAIFSGLEQASVMLFFVSRESVVSDYCIQELQHALELNKRIIPILLENADNIHFPEAIKFLQYIDFSKALLTEKSKDNQIIQSLSERIEKDVETRREKSLFEKKVDELVKELMYDKAYYQQHKIYLVQALKWERQNYNNSILLRGFNLENAIAWLKQGNNKTHQPTQLHRKFINESELKIGTLHSEVFISYSRKDADFARKINEQLQLSGKTTWFDQESISTGVDFGAEIRKGIIQSDNFLFIISPDSVVSPFCEEETLFANSHNKRIITILGRNTDTASIPPLLSSIQWIDFVHREQSYSFGQLLRTLDTDRHHVELHTKYAVRAEEWHTGNKPSELLLRGVECMVAKDWLSKSKNKIPFPTKDMRDFIEKSYIADAADKIRQKKQITRLRILLAVSILMIAIASMGIFIAYRKNIVAEMAQKEAIRSAEMYKKQESNTKDLLKYLLNDTEIKVSDYYTYFRQRSIRYYREMKYKEAYQNIQIAELCPDVHPDVNNKSWKAKILKAQALKQTGDSFFNIWNYESAQQAYLTIQRMDSIDNKINALIKTTYILINASKTGKQHLVDKNYTEALTSYRQILFYNPKDQNAYNALVECEKQVRENTKIIAKKINEVKKETGKTAGKTVNLAIESVGKYDSDLQVFPVQIMGVTANIEIPPYDYEAKRFKDEYQKGNLKITATKYEIEGKTYYTDIEISSPKTFRTYRFPDIVK